jgi:hypothetical protein
LSGGDDHSVVALPPCSLFDCANHSWHNHVVVSVTHVVSFSGPGSHSCSPFLSFVFLLCLWSSFLSVYDRLVIFRIFVTLLSGCS